VVLAYIQAQASESKKRLQSPIHQCGSLKRATLRVSPQCSVEITRDRLGLARHRPHRPCKLGPRFSPRLPLLARNIQKVLGDFFFSAPKSRVPAESCRFATRFICPSCCCLKFRASTSTSTMKLTNPGAVPVYTVAGPSTARPLPDWLARRRKRSSKYDAENLNNFELLQEFEFEEGMSKILHRHFL